MKAVKFRRILCPINFADGSQRTVERASLLASLYDAELRLFHVVCDRSRSPDAEGLISSLFALTRTLPERTRISAALAHGDPSSEIIQHARLMGADLIVLGSERRSAPGEIRRTIVDDVATRAGCPVLHVRPHLLPPLPDAVRGFTEVVCCVEHVSSAPLTRENYAHALARHGDARVTLLSVVESDEDSSESMPAAADDFVRSRHVVQVSLTGSPGAEIVALALQIRADLIVIGARDDASSGQRLGSTAAYVIVHAPCPVLIVPSSSDASHAHVVHLGARDESGLSQ